MEDVISITWGGIHVVHLLGERDALAVDELSCGGAILRGCHSPDSCDSLGMLLEKVSNAIFTQALEHTVQLGGLLEGIVGAVKEEGHWEGHHQLPLAC
eukprot:3820193-Ditylum_brightwellii.AAC.1